MKEIAGARVVECREVARGSRWLVLEPDEPDAWAPGHDVALYVPELDGRWVRHPYTVSWAAAGRLGILFRVIPGGRITPAMEHLRPGEVLRLGGRFGEPIARVVRDAPRVVVVTTGTGVGPALGFAADADRSVSLLSGFREAVDIPRLETLERVEQNPNVRWLPTISRADGGWRGLRGRVTAHLHDVAAPDAHWHLIGNGAMIAELHAGLLAAGVERERVTSETYFNRGVSPPSAGVAAVAAAVRGGSPSS